MAETTTTIRFPSCCLSNIRLATRCIRSGVPTELPPNFITIKGNTATGATKSAKVETGLNVQVPLFINEGDVLLIDTRDGKYISRA